MGAIAGLVGILLIRLIFYWAQQVSENGTGMNETKDKERHMEWTNRKAVICLTALLIVVVSCILVSLGIIDKMTTVVFLSLFSLIFIAEYLYRRHQAKKKGKTPEGALTYEHPETRKLVMETLQKMNCKVEVTEEDRLLFEYQGVRFLIEAVDDCLFINLIWPWCYTISLYDAHEYSRLRQVVNELNANGTCSVFYFPNKETDEMVVHMKKHMLFVSDITEPEAYMNSAITGLFGTVRQLEVDMEKMRVQEHEAVEN